MVRKLVATAILLLVGYVAGVYFGYRAAVVDYVENDAEQIETAAQNMYPSHTAEGEPQRVPDEVGELIKEVQEEDDDAGARAFQ